MKKLKHQYKQSIQSTRHDYLWKVYPNVRSSIFKKFSFQQERSFYFLHRIEYKSYSLKIRVARGTGLPHVWDDFPTCVYKVAKSWKHNSKRAHQYYKEHEQK
ncbi:MULTISPECIES: hypothetical protein [Acinetobacter]|jgi:hypothetical protein|uniref:hypothetical protein n=1 Tax=Acinetobacter TaxID=469 RepID=UPI001029382F|nr:hypothetical protein [Acinetobacter johnsonii]MDH1241555.1 hypothetical protein [Acinetobacter johnsonii]RZN87975.1 hypothetical protein EXE24_12615 [Acinetobacter johnsonii]UJA00419.1 hypothetical protein GBN93_05325 [Acinetobacter johnsonii]